jgi:hypothetical protein
MSDAMKILAGNANRPLTEAIAAYIGLPLCRCQVRRFADMEVFVEIQENVRGADAFVVQSTSFPTNDHLMELLIMMDALRRASARRITAVLPYFGYARQDRKPGPRTPISAKLVANLITRAGADRVLTVDLHAGQIQGFFDIPTDNLFAAPVMVRDIKDRMDRSNIMVVSPDVGGVVRARALAKRLDAAAPGSTPESHGLWVRRLSSLARSLEACAWLALALVAAIAAAVIAVATRAGLAQRRDAIEIVHGLGATDGFIAARFAYRATRDAAVGAACGALAALPVLLLLTDLAAPFAPLAADAAPAARGAAIAWLGRLPMTLWLSMPALPAAAALIGYATTQLTVRRWLRRLP